MSLLEQAAPGDRSRPKSKRLSTQQFDDILKSNETQVISLTKDLTTSTSQTSDDVQESLNPAELDFDAKRRSMYRSPGYASSPDLATLIQKAKAARQRQEGTDEDTQPSEDGEDADEVLAATSNLAQRRRAARDSSIMSGSSYIVVPDFKELSLTSPVITPTLGSPVSATSRDRDRAISLGTPSATLPSSATNKPKMMMPVQSPPLNDKSFGNTMRKTSGFFKKRFGGPSAKSTGTFSQPTSPAHSSFPSTSQTLPPVPDIPAEYASPKVNKLDGLDQGPPVPPKPGTPEPLRLRTAPRMSPSPSKSSQRANVEEEQQVVSEKKTIRELPFEQSQSRLALSAMDWDKIMAGLESSPPLEGQKAEFSPRTKAKERKSPAMSMSRSTSASSVHVTGSPSRSIPMKRDASMPSIHLSTHAELDQSENMKVLEERRDSLPTTDLDITPTSSKMHLNDQRTPNLNTQVPLPISRLSSTLTVESPTKANARLSVVGLLPSSNGILPSSLMQSSSLTGSKSSLQERKLTKEDLGGMTLEEKAQELAEKCWTLDESFLPAHKIAEYLGTSGRLNKAVLKQYMARFDFASARLDAAFRSLCEKLYLKAETQQVDRILDAFSQQYFRDNPSTIFGSADVVHATTYSLLLLNTDLHVAELSSRMSAKQFIRNTMAAIHAHFSTSNSSPRLPLALGPKAATVYESSPSSEAHSSRVSFDRFRDTLSRNKRSDSVSSLTSDGQTNSDAPYIPHSPSKQKSLPTTSSQQRAWDTEMENLLKEIYNEIRLHPIYQPLTNPATERRNSLTLSPASSPYATWNGNFNRSNSRRSQVSLGSDWNAPGKRASVRGLLGPDPSRSSSPTPSFSTTFSGRQSSSTTNFTTPTSPLSSNPIIGFAGSLSTTIIREQREEDADSEDNVLTEEELALLGAPWAKEGILQRKHYWEAPGKRSKDKNWLQSFVVISKGEVKMFKFGDSSKGGSSSFVGGGNWMTNAQTVGELSLMHSLCSAMPPPGYSAERPHVFVLTLSNGSSYFFQAGTEDLVQEWVSTCNYWAARLSREPLTGGVSNIDYGWNRVTKQAEEDTEDLASVRSGKSGRSHKSIRSAKSKIGSVARSPFGSTSFNMNDRVHLADWRAPAHPTTASQLSEEAQVKSLKKYVQKLQSELEAHNEVRSPMSALFSSRSPNASKALTNWERRSQYLLSEIVKYSTYIISLQQAIKRKHSKSAQKSMDAMLKTAEQDQCSASAADSQDRLSTNEEQGKAPKNTPTGITATELDRSNTPSAIDLPDAIKAGNASQADDQSLSSKRPLSNDTLFYDAPSLRSGRNSS